MGFKKKKIITYIFYILIGSAVFTGMIFYFFKLGEDILPKEVEFKINNPKVETKIKSQIHAIIKESISKKQTRTQLFDNISNVLSTYDSINAYSIHLGFDRKLVIFANVQYPVLAVHDNTGNIFVVGSAMKIIEKNPNKTLLQNMPAIFLSDMQVQEKNMDFSSFLTQINLINNCLQGTDLKIQKIIWAKSTGFTVNLKNFDEKNDSADKNDSQLILHFGHQNIADKIENYKTIAMVLKQKNLKPNEIDLDLIDRAFIK